MLKLKDFIEKSNSSIQIMNDRAMILEIPDISTDEIKSLLSNSLLEREVAYFEGYSSQNAIQVWLENKEGYDHE